MAARTPSATLPSLTSNALEPRIRRRVEEAIEDLLDPEATVLFTQATTQTTNALPVLLTLGLTTAVTSGNLIVATTTLEDRVNLLHKAVNQLVDILQSNLLALST